MAELKFDGLAINLANIGRAVPSYAMMVIPLPLTLTLAPILGYDAGFGLTFLPIFLAMTFLAIPPLPDPATEPREARSGQHGAAEPGQDEADHDRGPRRPVGGIGRHQRRRLPSQSMTPEGLTDVWLSSVLDTDVRVRNTNRIGDGLVGMNIRLELDSDA